MKHGRHGKHAPRQKRDNRGSRRRQPDHWKNSLCVALMPTNFQPTSRQPWLSLNRLSILFYSLSLLLRWREKLQYLFLYWEILFSSYVIIISETPRAYARGFRKEQNYLSRKIICPLSSCP